MSTCAAQTSTMLSSNPDTPVHILGLTATRDETTSQPSSKRKRNSSSGLDTPSAPFTTRFTIKPYPESPDSRPATFKPIRVISRCQLPLAFLDTTLDVQYPRNRFFTARIDILESDGTWGEQKSATTKVLIAQHETNRSLYAIERVQARTYSICKLASWLQERDTIQLWDPSIVSAYPTSLAPTGDGPAVEPWWQHATVNIEPVPRPAKRARLSMVRRPTEELRIKPEPHQVTIDYIPHMTELNGAIATEPLQEPIQELPTVQEHLEALVQQYLDAVYTSKTSLAYFAKGPITRMRNAFTSPDENAPPTHELVTFLRSMLLSPKAGEKKFYEKLPSIIKAIPVGTVSDEDAPTKPSKAKKSKKKPKISRDGVYPAEDAFIKRWWRSEMPSADNASQETIEMRIRRRIGDLRVRETLAQMILMLEVIALESLATYKGPSEAEPLKEGDEQLQDASQPQPKKRKKKLDDIALQLDLLLDKLSIWHATEETGILDFDIKTAKQQDNKDGNGKDGSDRLYSFCVEVIVPFYMSRLPEQAQNVNKKLGGPAIGSSKRKAMRPPLKSKKAGESKEPETKKSRRSLARVATDTTGKTGDRRTPILARSATDTALLRQQSIKRETSEAPLAAIPFKRSPSRARQSVSQLRHLQGREMDLTATSAAAAAKLKHKARVEDDLKEAIATLKKPNRDLAAGAYMAEIEKRGIGSASRSRKPATTVRRAVRDVQVTATPRANRKMTNMVEQTPVHYHQNPFIRPTSIEAAPLTDVCIPSSGVRLPPSIVPGTVQRSVTARDLAQTGIAETPSKVSTTKLFTSGPTRRTIFATPVKSSTRLFPEDPNPTSNIFETPVKAAGSPPQAATPPMVEATPLKATGSNHASTSPIAFATPAKQIQEPSIYDALGWNDDDDFA
jgi:DNA replication regulator SLD3